MFVEEIPDRISALEALAQSRDWQQLAKAAHQLKGAAGSYGFNAVTPFAARLESTAKDGCEEEEILSALNELLEVCRRLRSGAHPGKQPNRRRGGRLGLNGRLATDWPILSWHCLPSQGISVEK